MLVPPVKNPGQGSYLRHCSICSVLMLVRATGRRRKFCSDRCRQEHHRRQEFRDKNSDPGEGPYLGSSLSQIPEENATKSITYKGDLVDRGSPIKAFGRGCYAPPSAAMESPDRAKLIRAALQLESEARWRAKTGCRA